MITTNKYPVIDSEKIPKSILRVIDNIVKIHEIDRGFQIFENPSKNRLSEYDENFAILSNWLRINGVNESEILILVDY